MFPSWDTTVASPKVSAGQPVSEHRTLMMPIRRRTRSADRAYHISCERALNDAHVAERNKAAAFPRPPLADTPVPTS